MDEMNDDKEKQGKHTKSELN
jgi:hypothetical protein